jgi:hypothetical protein
MRKKWVRVSVGVFWMFLLMAFAFPAVMGERADTAWIIISAIASVATVTVADYLTMRRRGRRKDRSAQ